MNEKQKYDFTRNTPTVFRFFLKAKDILIVPSAPIVFEDHPTSDVFPILGMTQFKDYFLGYKEPKYLELPILKMFESF